MSVLQKIKDGVHALEAKIEGALSGEAAKVEGAVGTEVAKVEGEVTGAPAEVAKVAEEVIAVVETDWKGLVLEARTFLAEIKQRFPGDAVYNDAQAFIKKVEALL